MTAPGPNLSVSVNANNQITNAGFSYDAAGNTTADGTYSYAYNAENELISAAGVNYAYDGNGLRVEKSSGTLYWRSYTEQVLEETHSTRCARSGRARTGGNPGPAGLRPTGVQRADMQRDYVLGVYPEPAAAGRRGQENDYTTTCSPTYRFTGYEFDSETGNFYAYARYYDPRPGRFLSADPLNGGVPTSTGASALAASTLAGLTSSSPATGVFAFSARPLAMGLPTAAPGGTGCTGCGCRARAPAATGLSDAQSLNRYSYVVNNPETLTDMAGFYFCPGTTSCSYYGVACSESRTPWARTYYCNAAPRACATFPDAPWENCVRLCLQIYDICLWLQGLGPGQFSGCIIALHIECFTECGNECGR